MSEPTATPDPTDKDSVWLIRLEISAEIAPTKLALTDIIADPARLVDPDNENTDELRAVDSATNAADMAKLLVCCCDMAPEAETESEVTADLRVLASTLRAVVNATSPAVSADAAALTAIDNSETD
jgi:hypothetical protein